MFNRFARLGVCLALPVIALAVCPPAWGQIRVEHSVYSDLVMHVNQTAGEVFASPEGRKASTAELLKAIDRLVPMVQAEMKQPAIPAIAQRMKTDPAFAQQIKLMFTQQIKNYDLFRLALDEPNAAATYQSEMAKGGRSAAIASVDRAAADWLNAGQDSSAQTAAFDKLRAAIKASGQNVSWDFWYWLWNLNPAASESVGTPLLAYLKQYPNAGSLEARRMLVYVGIKVKQMQLDGKPMKIEGTLITGAPFSTAAWKGKVVLIDGWYTHSAPTANFLPQIQGLLAKHQSEGLEVLGIGYDETFGVAREFLKGHPEYTFPQMYQPVRIDADYGCFVTGQYRFGAAGLGAEMVIDRKGVLHYLKNPLNAQDVEAEVVKLLAQAP